MAQDALRAARACPCPDWPQANDTSSPAAIRATTRIALQYIQMQTRPNPQVIMRSKCNQAAVAHTGLWNVTQGRAVT